MGTIATGLQTRQKDCYAPSDRVRLVLRTNGEEKTSVIGLPVGIVPAGFDAPTVAPTGVVSGSGTLSGYYVYCYVYASSRYPYVENAVPTANGELWPRSNPSPMSSVQDCSAGSKTVTLTVTKTTQTGVDKILIYRTNTATSSALASAAAEAGELYYVATADNNGVAGTNVIIDGGITSTGEALELDNYPAQTAEFCVFDGNYWWAAGNPEYTATVTLDGTSTVTTDTGSDLLFTGRNGQFVTFDGVSTGGFDGVGTFYADITADNTVVLYEDADLTTPLAVYFTGTTTMRIRGYTNILYRSKVRNPFSWGYTQTQVATDQSVTNVAQTFTLNLGGGSVTAMAVSPNGKQLIIHFENPQRTASLSLEFADDIDAFANSQQIIDNTGSVTAHFALFNGYVGEAPMLLGMDTYNGTVLACDGFRQFIVSDAMGSFLLDLDRDDRAPKFFHGSYDSETDMNCFWARLYDTTERNNIMFWTHAPTQAWGWMPDFDVLCSATCLDSETNERLVIGGTELGFMGRLLDSATFNNWLFDQGNQTLSNNDSITLPDTAPSVTQTDPASGVFRTFDLWWSVGQEVLLFYANSNGEYTITAAEIGTAGQGYLPGDRIWVNPDTTYVSGVTIGAIDVVTVGATGEITSVSVTIAGLYLSDQSGGYGVNAGPLVGTGGVIVPTFEAIVGGYQVNQGTITSAGTGYRSGDSFKVILDVSNATVSVQVNGSGGIIDVEGGGGTSTDQQYNILYIGDVPGSGADLTAVLTGDAVTSVTINNGGSRYRYGDPLQFSGGDGSGAAATVSAVNSTGVITSVSVSAGGNGYTSPPGVVVAGRIASAALSAATINVTMEPTTVLYERTVASIEQISDEPIWETTLTEPYTEAASGLQCTWHPRYIGGIVNVLYVPHDRSANCDAYYANFTYDSLDAFATYSVTLDNYMRVGDTEFLTDLPTPWGDDDQDLFIGGIPTVWRSYFDLETPTVDKRSTELWFTAGPATVSNLPGARFYIEFLDDSLTEDCFPMYRDATAVNGRIMLSVFNRTEVPSYLRKEFGIELINVLNSDFTFYNLTIKTEVTA